MLLRKDDPWIASLTIPDIRDWRVVDADGRTVGFVQSLMVDDREGRVDALFIGANDRYGIDDVEIEDHRLCLRSTLSRRSSETESPNRGLKHFQEAFRNHYNRVYGHGDDDAAPAFEALQDAYALGRTMAGDADYSGRSFRRAEEDLRARYAAENMKLPYPVVREAVRFGYEAAQRQTHGEVAGLDRELKVRH